MNFDILRDDELDAFDLVVRAIRNMHVLYTLQILLVTKIIHNTS